mmetsp:Transcript_8393/g.12248  ORF Transcript_8393/g.12248 Transcript_8393/m.12248 type:complete len:80 (-) Transcript_8393:672-911(-)
MKRMTTRDNVFAPHDKEMVFEELIEIKGFDSVHPTLLSEESKHSQPGLAFERLQTPFPAQLPGHTRSGQIDAKDGQIKL